MVSVCPPPPHFLPCLRLSPKRHDWCRTGLMRLFSTDGGAQERRVLGGTQRLCQALAARINARAAEESGSGAAESKAADSSAGAAAAPRTPGRLTRSSSKRSNAFAASASETAAESKSAAETKSSDAGSGAGRVIRLSCVVRGIVWRSSVAAAASASDSASAGEKQDEPPSTLRNRKQQRDAAAGDKKQQQQQSSAGSGSTGASPSVTVTYEHAGAEHSVSASHCVLAVPPNLWASLRLSPPLPPPQRLLSARCSMGAVIKTKVFYQR